MSAGGRSLLPFLPAPVAVGDPQGRAVYLNPLFLERFDVTPGEVRGRPLAELFEGGGREAVLQATASVCADGREVRFRLRDRQRGYSAVAAPILEEGEVVGLLFLFSDEAVGDERLLAFRREIREPLEDLAGCLDAMLEQTGGRRSERFRTLVEEGIRSVERIRKWTGQLAAEAEFAEGAEATGPFDPLGVVRAVGQTVSEVARASGRDFDLLLPVALPPVRGDGDRLAVALTRFVRQRIEAAPRGSALTLTAKLLEADRCVLLSLTEVAPPDAASFSLDDDTPPREVEATVGAWGGAVARVSDPVAGITTAIRLPIH